MHLRASSDPLVLLKEAADMGFSLAMFGWGGESSCTCSLVPAGFGEVGCRGVAKFETVSSEMDVHCGIGPTVFGLVSFGAVVGEALARFGIVTLGCDECVASSEIAVSDCSVPFAVEVFAKIVSEGRYVVDVLGKISAGDGAVSDVAPARVVVLSNSWSDKVFLVGVGVAFSEAGVGKNGELVSSYLMTV